MSVRLIPWVFSCDTSCYENQRMHDPYNLQRFIEDPVAFRGIASATYARRRAAALPGENSASNLSSWLAFQASSIWLTTFLFASDTVTPLPF